METTFRGRNGDVRIRSATAVHEGTAARSAGRPRTDRFREGAMAVEAGERPEVADEESADADRNAVAVEFADGTRRRYAAVIRPRDGGWLHAERLVGDGDGLDEAEFEAINPEAVRRIRSACVHVFDAGVVHHGEGLLVDPDRLLADCGLG